MTDTKWKLARIRDTMLGFEDHGILTFFITLEYADPGGKFGEGVQGFGGYDLRGDNASEMIQSVLRAVGVDNWSRLTGKMVWADAEWTKVHAIRGVDTGIESRPAEIAGRGKHE